jgi:spore maturation protein CgeB
MSFFKRNAVKGLDAIQSAINGVEDKLNPRPNENIVEEEIEKHIRPGAPTVLYVAIRYDYGNESRGLSYEHHNFYQTLINMNLSVIYFDLDRLRARYGEARMGELLREAAYYYEPDFLLYLHYLDWVPHSVWADVRKNLRTKTIMWMSDDHWRYEETEKVWRLFDLVTTTDRKGERRRLDSGWKNVHLTQWACNHFLTHNSHLERDIDVAFIGQIYGERRDFISRLRESGINVSTYGLGWEGSGRISQGEMANILNRSKIVLDLSKSSQGTSLQIKGRVFEATGAGALLLTENAPHLEDYFVIGEEIVVYDGVADCTGKIQALLKDETRRSGIAEAGYRRAIGEHTFEKRFRAIFASAEAVQKNRKQ